MISRYNAEVLGDIVVSRPKKKKARVFSAKSKAEFEAFYRSKPWRVLRMKAIKKYGRTCMCCGATNIVIHVDHIKPRSKYPELELELSNLQILCEDCNMGKGGWDETDWREPESPCLTDADILDAEYAAIIGKLN